MIAERLKNETKEAHQALEKLLIPRIKKTAALADYAQLLALFYGYYQPLEQLIEKHIGTKQLKDIKDRRKAGWLLSDMAYAGAYTDALKLAGNLPEINNTAQAMGALYVMEGSALGGRIIKKMLQASLGMEGDDGFLFFNGYGEDMGRLWGDFIAAINEYEMQEGNGTEIIAGANDTFIKFREWIEEQHSRTV